MSVTASLQTVSSSANVALATAGACHMDVIVRCNAGTVYLGGASMSSSAGWLSLTTAATSGAPIEVFRLWPGDVLYGIGSSSSISVEVLTRATT